MTETGGYGEGRPDVEAAMRRARRTERPTRRTRPVPAAPPDNLLGRRQGQAATVPAASSTRAKLNFGEGPVIPLFLIGSGMYLAWFGVHYWRSDVKYPTDPIKSVLQGKGLPGATRTPTAEQAAVIAAEGQGITTSTAQGQAVPGLSQGIPAGVAAPGGAAHNQQVGALLAAGYGWAPSQNKGEWDALVSLWNQESGWSNTADTRVTHAGGDNAGSTVFAYGIPQARPYSKMPQQAWPPDKGGQADPHAQIQWGLAYIKAAYGSPGGAWAHEKAQGWY